MLDQTHREQCCLRSSKSILCMHPSLENIGAKPLDDAKLPCLSDVTAGKVSPQDFCFIKQRLLRPPCHMLFSTSPNSPVRCFLCRGCLHDMARFATPTLVVHLGVCLISHWTDNRAVSQLQGQAQSSGETAGKMRSPAAAAALRNSTVCL